MASKNFDEEREERELHEFTLGGRTFHLRPSPPPATFLDGHEYKSLQGVIDFLRACIVPADRDSFEELLTGKDVFVEDNDLCKVSSWYLEVISGRPTNGSSPSGAGPETTEGTSEEPSPSLVESSAT